MQYTVINRKVDLITIDVSFISLDIVIPAVVPFMHADTLIVALIKPQFEVGKEQVGKKGVVKDPILHRQVIERLSSVMGRIGLEIRQVIPSPVLGPKGNREFFIFLNRQ